MEAAIVQVKPRGILHTEIVAPLSPMKKYNLRHVLYLAAIPIICAAAFVALLSIFSKLNLYYLQSNGLIVDDQIRTAYFHQVEMRIWEVLWYFLAQVLVTIIVGAVCMKWANAPFVSAEKMVLKTISDPDSLKPGAKMLSESLVFDRFVWQHCLRIRSGGPNTLQDLKLPNLGVNYLFLGKFYLVFGALSLLTGSVMGIIINTVFDKIVNLAINLVQNANVMTHYFVAQQEILKDAAFAMTILSLLFFFVIGLQISNYMSKMIFVFCRTMKEDRFPVQLRNGDIYDGFADALNKSWTVIQKKS